MQSLTLHRHASKPGHVIDKRGRRKSLTDGDKRIIVDAIGEFSNNGTPLSINAMKDCVALFVSRFPKERPQELPFTNGRPGDAYIKTFIKRHP